jgi:hypothetical protein
MRAIVAIASFIVLLTAGLGGGIIFLVGEYTQGAFVKEFWWLYAFVIIPAGMALSWATHTPKPKEFKDMTEREKRRLPRW